MKFLFALTLACVFASTFAQLVCGPNERWRSCTRDQTCIGIRRGESPYLPRPFPCVAGCRCYPGDVRDDNNECVWPEDCFLQTCPDRNAVRVPCANRCPGGTCSHPDHSICITPCEVNGCECRPGWLKLSSRDPVCVPEDLCGIRLRQAGFGAAGSAEEVEENQEDDGQNNYTS